MARVLPISRPGALELAAEAVLSGRIVAFPTDTVYGIGGLPAAGAVRALYRAKARPDAKPIPLLLDTPERLEQVCARISPLAMRLADACWPGALTLVVPGRADLASVLGSRDGTIGVRVPDHDGLRELIQRCGGMLAVTSANRSGQPELTSAQAVQQELSEYVELVLDGGASPAGLPSTVVDATGPRPRILRSGPVDGRVQEFLNATSAELSLSRSGGGP